MQAIQLTKYGEPEESLRLAEIAEPDRPKPGQILIRLEYAPINDNDMLLARGLYTIQPKLPSVVGNEGVGKVLAVGDGVHNVKIGDRVVIPLGVFTWAGRVLAPAENAIVLPAEIDPRQAAMLSINPPAAALLLEEFVSLKRGDWIVQNASNSGVGRSAKFCSISRMKVSAAFSRGEVSSLGTNRWDFPEEPLATRKRPDEDLRTSEEFID